MTSFPVSPIIIIGNENSRFVESIPRERCKYVDMKFQTIGDVRVFRCKSGEHG